MHFNGSALGAGVYFSDMAATSLAFSYSGAARGYPRLLLLCDVEVGSPGHRMAGGRPVSRGAGVINSFVDGNCISSRLAGVKVPDLGASQGGPPSYGGQFCVYDVAQIQIRYLVFVGDQH